LGSNWFFRRFTKCISSRRKDFYNRWYIPNNVTLTIAGDFDVKQAKAWVQKIFWRNKTW
jgi:predicted Zn-dependent peptidase